MSVGLGAADEMLGEWQLTYSPVNKLLDNNDNFSADGRFLVFDTRETFGSGIGNGTTIMKVSVSTGLENVIYSPTPVILGSQAAPGLGAASYSPVDDVVAFIHGPFADETPTLGFYAATNRRGGVARADGSGDAGFLDCRDVKSDVTPPGAHRGGSHRHEFSADGKRIGFTYDDAILTTYGRTLGYMVEHKNAPCGVGFYSALLIPIKPTADAQTGDLVRAADDSWIGAKGLMRGFIGNVKEADGTVKSSLFVVDIPENVDITTASSGTKTEYPKPPVGTRIRRLTTSAAAGIVRGSLDGTRVAFFMNAADGKRQVFIMNSQGSETSEDASMRPVQVTNLPAGASQAIRWHPSGNSIAVLSENGVAATCVKPGPLFGKTVWLSSYGGSASAEALVWSRDGKMLAYNRRTPTYDAAGKLVKDFNGNDFRQIYLVKFPDKDGNGIVDSIE